MFEGWAKKQCEQGLPRKTSCEYPPGKESNSTAHPLTEGVSLGEY